MGERELSKISDDEGNTAPTSKIDRRSFVRTATLGGATAAALAAAGGLSMPAFAETSKTGTSSGTSVQLVDAGAGMHAGIGTVQMMGVATISRELTTCAVAQMGLDLTQLSQLLLFLNPILGGILGPGWSGPFAMLMYSENVMSYNINRSTGVITAKGTVRSITKIGGILIEDATSPYLAVATDARASGMPDSYYLSFTTPFWSRPLNPLATPSTFHPGWSMFGGNLIVGLVNVAP